MKREGYVEDVLELLQPLGAVSARAMFGGWGVYVDGAMFALIADERLFFKIDEASRGEFEAAGGEPFVYDAGNGRKPVAMSYWTPPPEAEGDAYALLPWARRGVEAAGRARAKKAAAASKPAKRAAATSRPAPKKKPAARKASPAKKAAVGPGRTRSGG